MIVEARLVHKFYHWGTKALCGTEAFLLNYNARKLRAPSCLRDLVVKNLRVFNNEN